MVSTQSAVWKKCSFWRLKAPRLSSRVRTTKMLYDKWKETMDAEKGESTENGDWKQEGTVQA